MRQAPGSAIAGFVPRTNEAILSGIWQKKAITVNYDFFGYRYATMPTADPATNPLQKNQLFYRERTSPGKYAPLLLVIVHAYSATYIDVDNNDQNKLSSGSAALISWFDNSASAWADSTNDHNRYVSAIGAADSGGTGYARLTLNGAPSLTPQDTADAVCAGVDTGVIDMINYVVVDQEIDLRAAALPAAITGDFVIDAIYAARLNQRFMNGYGLYPSNFIAAIKAANQRLIFDNPQV